MLMPGEKSQPLEYSTWQSSELVNTFGEKHLRARPGSRGEREDSTAEGSERTVSKAIQTPDPQDCPLCDDFSFLIIKVSALPQAPFTKSHKTQK